MMKKREKVSMVKWDEELTENRINYYNVEWSRGGAPTAVGSSRKDKKCYKERESTKDRTSSRREAGRCR